MNEEARATVPISFLQQLQPLLAQMGLPVDLPGMVRFAPTISMNMPIRSLALELGQSLSRTNIYVRGDDVVTVDEATGDVRRMTPGRFPGWCEEFVTFQGGGKSRMRDSLSREDASQVLELDIFRGCLRKLRAVHLMRLPVRRKTGLIEFLEPGYDVESEIFTVDKLKYAMDWTIEQAAEWLHVHGEEYPWPWPDDGKERWLVENRSWAVQVFSMVGIYCKAMFTPGTLRPMIVYIGNQAGTGKSILAEMALIPVFGHAQTVDCPNNDENMAKTLETVARTMQPYAFFDDVRYGLDSAPLNRFITSTSHTGRCMGGNSEMFSAPQMTQVFATGNGLKVTTDLNRRALIVELFLAGERRGRKFKRVIDGTYLMREDVRANFLSALCALVRNYIDALGEEGCDPEMLKHKQPLESFEDYSGLIGSIVMAAGYLDPLSVPDIAPNEDEDEMRELLIIAATAREAAHVFDRKELVEIARTAGLLESLVGTLGEGDMDSKTTKRWGRQLQAWRGRELVDKQGRRFRFGSKRQKKGATYPLSFL